MKKLIRWTVLAGAGLLALLVGPELTISTFSTAAAHQVRALLAKDAPITALPEHVTITMDGSTATFTKGTEAYAQLIALLRLKYVDGAVEQAGWYPSTEFARSGELTIQYYGLPFRCALRRSTANPNFLRIAIPYGNGRPGYALPWILDENRLPEFVNRNIAAPH